MCLGYDLESRFKVFFRRNGSWKGEWQWSRKAHSRIRCYKYKYVVRFSRYNHKRGGVIFCKYLLRVIMVFIIFMRHFAFLHSRATGTKVVIYISPICPADLEYNFEKASSGVSRGSSDFPRYIYMTQIDADIIAGSWRFWIRAWIRIE